MTISIERGSMAIAILLITVSFFPGISISDSVGSETAYLQTEHENLLLILYMSADVAGSPLNWSADINEMESGLNSDNLTVIALVDPEGYGDTIMYRIVPDLSDSPQILSIKIANPLFLPTDNEANMGDPVTLTDFARYCIENHYEGGMVGLVLWGHGGGWAGVEADKLDYLSCAELTAALQEIDDVLGRPIDLLAFDACAMGSVEFLSELSGLSLLAVTSEMDIPASGFPYDAILERISTNLPMNDLDIAFSFADEYVKFGTLMTDTSAQAAVIDLGRLEPAKGAIAEFSETGILFDPIFRALFNGTRDECVTLQPTGSIDAIEFFSELSSSADAPRRVARQALYISETLTNAILRNRVFVSSDDMLLMRSESLRGIAIYYPAMPAALNNYEDTSPVSKSWSDFLATVMSARWDVLPAPDIKLAPKDLKYSDGLNDTFEIRWDDTSEIQEWEFEIYPMGEFEPILEDSEVDEAEMFIIDSLAPGFYDVFAYGRNGTGKYLDWGGFEGLTIYRLIGITVHLPDSVSISETTLRIRNLRAGEMISLSVEERDMLLSLVIPEPHKIGDRLLVELCRNTEVLASGLLVIDGTTFEVGLFAEPAPSPLLIFLATISMAFLLAFAMILFLRSSKRKHSIDWRRR